MPRSLPARPLPEIDGAALAKGVGGCLGRFALVVVVLFVALVAVVYVFARALFKGY